MIKGVSRNVSCRFTLVVLTLLVGNSACQERSPKPEIHAEKPRAVPINFELAWPEVTRNIESGNVTWIVPALNRRVFVTLKNGQEHVTTAPTNSALDELLQRVDPTKKNIVVARKYANYKELDWQDIQSFISRNKLLVVQQNGGHRVLIDTVDEESSPSGYFVIMQPNYGDITPLVPKKYANGMYVKHIDVREISWQMATDELTLNNVSSIFLAHGDLVYLYMKDGRQLLTVEPTPEEALTWLKTFRPDFKNTTVE